MGWWLQKGLAYSTASTGLTATLATPPASCGTHWGWQIWTFLPNSEPDGHHYTRMSDDSWHHPDRGKRAPQTKHQPLVRVINPAQPEGSAKERQL